MRSNAFCQARSNERSTRRAYTRAGSLTLLVSFLVLLSAQLGLAQQNRSGQIRVEAQIQNLQGWVHIGTIDWNIRARPDGLGDYMTAQFNFAGGWGLLDQHYDFRWFQIIKADNNPPTWQRMVLNYPVVDPPVGGWDYQYGNDHVRNGGNRNQRNPGEGADNSPYYENDDDGNIYRFPNFGNFHMEGRFSRFEDAPSGVARDEVRFQTFLVVVLHGNNTFQQGQRNFLKLAAFDWVFSVNNQGNFSITVAPLGRNFDHKKQDIGRALNNSGFQGWQSLQPGAHSLVPEPASLLALGAGLVSLLARRRRVA